MNRYRIELTRSAHREFVRLPRDIRERIQTAIDGLAENPRPHGVTKLEDESNAYRIRVGNYRIVYEIHDDVLIVVVIHVRHRREVYR